MSTLLDMPYSISQMSYDLRRLRMKGLISRLPRSNTYVLTPRRTTRRDLLHQTPQPAPPPTGRRQRPTRPLPLRQALRVIDRHVTDYITKARMTA